jgi:ribosomal protein S18 acetylase RimI-like enzyme
MTHIRDAVPADVPRLAEIHVVSWQAAYRGVLSDAFLDGLTPSSRLAWWKSRLARVPTRWAVLVTLDGGTVTGFVSIGHCQDDDRRSSTAGEVYAMYVDPRYWGRGFGRDLLLGAEDRFRAEAYTDTSLWVLRDNQRARRFYELGGWQQGSRHKRMVIGLDAVTTVRYVRDLDPG